MTVLEMFIDVEQKLNKVNGSRFAALEDDEKAWWLNEGQNVLIKRRLDAAYSLTQDGHQVTRKRIDDLEELIKQVTLNCFYADEEHANCILPWDYLHPLYEDVSLAWNCNNLTPGYSAWNVKYAVVPFKLNYKPTGATSFYEELRMRIQISPGPSVLTLYDSDIHVDYASGVSDADEWFVIMNYVRERINKNSIGIVAYWEEYKDVRANNCFILVYEHQTNTLDNGQFGSTVDNMYTATNAVTSNEIKYDLTGLTYVTKKAELRIVKNDNFRRLLQHPFHKTTYKSPVGRYQDGVIKIYHDNTFVPITMVLTYYRKPALISLRHNQNCELKEHTHSEIVDITTELVSAHMANPNSQAIARTNVTKGQ